MNIPTDTERPNHGRESCFPHGGHGSSSLQECLNLLSQAKSHSPAPCHSRDNDANSSVPQQILVNFSRFLAKEMPEFSDKLKAGEFTLNRIYLLCR